jgi:hypothetical protein
MKLLLALSLLLLPACTAMDAKTVEAMAQSQSALCINSLMYGQVSYSNMGGKSTGTAGGGGTSKCGVHEVTFTNEGKLPPGATSTTTTTVPK